MLWRGLLGALCLLGGRILYRGIRDRFSLNFLSETKIARLTQTLGAKVLAKQPQAATDRADQTSDQPLQVWLSLASWSVKEEENENDHVRSR